jgi:hypothetical protein
MSLLVPLGRFDRAAVEADLILQSMRAAATRAAGGKGLPEPEKLPQTILEWATRYRRIDGHAFSLDRFYPLRDIYADTHKRIAVIKPAQRGLSELAINYTMFALHCGVNIWAPHKDGLNVGYVFPTESALGAFSKERFSGLRDESEELATILGSRKTDSTTFKQVGRSYLYLRGGWSERALLSFPADVMIVDEFDRMDPVAVALARRRMNASEISREYCLSTPTLPGIGIHALYLESDRRRYETLCPSCNEWATYDFFRDVRVDDLPYDTWRRWTPGQVRKATVTLNCPSCRKPISDEARCAPGRWIVDEPEADEIHGYWVPWWPFPMANMRQFAATAVNPIQGEQQEFFRSDLGLPYSVGGSRITAEMLLQLSAELPNGMLPDEQYRTTVMGVDVGSVFHYTIDSIYADDSRPTVRVMGTVNEWEDLDELMAQYKIKLCVVDNMPEIHGAAKFSERHPGRVLRATYVGGAHAMAGQLFNRPTSKKDDESGTLGKRRRFTSNKLESGEKPDDAVQINRTMALDALRSAVINAEERWPEAITRDPQIQAHFEASVRVTRMDKHGQEVAEWVHTAPDHWAHARVYTRIARLCLPKPKLSGSLAQTSVKSGWHKS